MDYEKKYKKALDNASVMHKCGNSDVKQIMEQLFPELMESEDERIRKAIIKHFKHEMENKSMVCYFGVSVDKMLAWLERQKPAEWSEEDGLMLDETLFFIQEFQKSDRCKNENDMQNSVTCENWLKSLKDRVQPQPKQEWGEEDKHEIQHIIDFLNHPDLIKATPTIADNCKNWLKSLKERYTWKPSDEQMKALDSATENCAYSEYQDCLRELIGQLKKLKE